MMYHYSGELDSTEKNDKMGLRGNLDRFLVLSALSTGANPNRAFLASLHLDLTFQVRPSLSLSFLPLRLWFCICLK